MKKIFIAFEVSTAIIVSGLTNGLSLKLTKIESKIYSLELLLYKSKPFIEIYSIVVLRKNCCFFFFFKFTQANNTISYEQYQSCYFWDNYLRMINNIDIYLQLHVLVEQ